MDLDYASIGARIRRCRMDRRMTVEKLAEEVGVGSNHLSKVENGKRKISLNCLVAVANALEVSADDLLHDNLTNSSSVAGSDIYNILMDCSADEKKMLTRMLEYLKKALIEFGR